eukprot:Nitzschia sp. Nitz4//scaffold88_size82704//64517//65185//NITZ4_005304-RA/size82704-processed-gene-0.57-mRNA-1//1//CDS//3329559530//9005//frame0
MMNKQCPSYKCSSGYQPVPKKKPSFQSTGCASMGGGSIMMNPGGDNGGAEKPYQGCCDQWHACYQTCGASKQVCDTSFETCAKKACDDSDASCTKDIEMSMLMMKLTGCKSFEDSQSNACDCVTDSRAAKRREQTVQSFYQSYNPQGLEKVSALAAKADTPSKLAGLFQKLLAKYPQAIEIKEDEMQSLFNKMKQKREDDNAEPEEVDTDTDEDAEEEKIEL